MSDRYRASLTITITTGDVRQAAEDAHTVVRATVNRHCVVARSSVLPFVRAGVATVAVTFDAANDAEADQIMRDAAAATQRPWDALFVVRGMGRKFHQVTDAGKFVA